MRAVVFRITLLLCLAGGVTGTLVVQRNARNRLLDERSLLLAAQREQARLLEDNRRLAGAQVPPEELARLRDERANLDRLRGEIETLKHQPVGATPAARPPVAATPKPVPAPPSTPLSGPRIPASEWKFTGVVDPAATFQSMVWAATQGETDQLASLLTFNAQDRARLEAIFARMSGESRAQYGSPEKLAANLLAVQVPRDIGSFGIVADLPVTPVETAVVMRLERGKGAMNKDATFIFRHENNGWRVVVPTEIVAGFERALSGGAAAKPAPATPPGV
jgi:hypothetical protein